ncbi:MAG: hypothetical protein AB8B49_07640 [Nitratireductor sp.]
MTYYQRKIDVIIMIIICFAVVYVCYIDSQTPRFMANGKPSGNVGASKMFAILLSLPIPYWFYLLIRPKRLLISLNQQGLKDTRLYNQTIQWAMIKNVELNLREHWLDRHPSYISINVPKEFVVNTLGDETKESFGVYTTE